MSSKDLRVPSFIRYDTGENVTKRKRETKKENVPKKKKKAGRRARKDMFNRHKRNNLVIKRLLKVVDVSRKLPGKCSSAEVPWQIKRRTSIQNFNILHLGTTYKANLDWCYCRKRQRCL